jgi:hypothetical protein
MSSTTISHRAAGSRARNEDAWAKAEARAIEEARVRALEDTETRLAARTGERQRERRIQRLTVVLFAVASIATIGFAQMMVFAR